MARRLQGTPWHVGVVGRKEDDPRRHRSRCKHYHKGERIVCSFFKGRCIGSAHCDGYKEIEKEPQIESVINETDHKRDDTPKYAIPDDMAKTIFPIGIEVVHVKYGTGIVKHIENNRIVVVFGDEEKILNVDTCVKNELMRRKD